MKFALALVAFVALFASAQAASANCALCELSVREIVNDLGQNATVSQIIAKVAGLCDDLPSTLRSECVALVDEYGASIIALLAADIQPAQVCTLLGLCTSTEAAQVKATFNMVGKGPLCPICEFIVAEVEKKITSNSTEQEIIHAVTGICTELPKSLESACDDYIDEKGAMIINQLVNKVTPVEVCTRLHECTSRVPSFVDRLTNIKAILEKVVKA
ncbi:SapB domain-containing protein [Capsaspora owczarzaki ATCC 30864]|uniref:SapB domain-containing protein n=1 Tax=Capsaspora owczarzaki (strain ATCC 30864) TaxID=595528 RepID=A0A0D2WHT5_CAPO3|nr:SapB domain-containing protein [Capsaspora owczarzaki ATCC 30864]KJE88378.1 SapB domain-containing protein [Capsaspora owczarzaki ATCC 30864]|eukprot:XP_004364911.1 SapB domain-containing protein [Capsaspora owczarzaki ATCC 30864]